AVAGQVGDEYAQVLVGELLCVEGHDHFVGGETVKEDDRAERRAGAGFVYVGSHLAAAGGGPHRVNLVRLTMREEVTDSAEQQTNSRFGKRAAVHRRS